ncbi:MAG: aminodeoxychorismate synthase component I [Gemmatimonadaceae bacterium]|nr:aminodeoxychorismate synthase component I [Gemmatimonadaceae bacterium]
MTASLPIVEELSPAPDPVDCCARFHGLPYLLFLDSARDPDRLGRYSFLSADPAVVLRSKGAQAERVSLPDGARTTLETHVLAEARSLLAPFRTEEVSGLPPFQGGIAGYLGYDWGAVLERLPAPRYDDLAIPDAMLGLYDWVLAWDHAAHRAWIISTGIPELGPARAHRAAARVAMVRARLAGPPRESTISPCPSVERAPSYPVDGVEQGAAIGLRSSFTHRGYLDVVRRVREYIIAGDIFQANISQRLEAPLREPPWSLYTRLRALNPAPFAAYLDFDDVRVLSASPERFLRLDPAGHVEARPIKGTRPRGIHPAHDAALGRALADSAKDRAENLMIVDLLRNDLSRVCAPGTVRVPELFAVEHYSTVHHLVSTITGTLEPGRDAVDLLCATFPGGSITGAPKVRAMEIIAELEPSRRGVYCGSIGYLALSGALDASIVIRTYLAIGNRVYFSVGGGIVADSDPEQEYHETLDKARALIAALAGAGRAVGGSPSSPEPR